MINDEQYGLDVFASLILLVKTKRIGDQNTDWDY